MASPERSELLACRNAWAHASREAQRKRRLKQLVCGGLPPARGVIAQPVTRVGQQKPEGEGFAVSSCARRNGPLAPCSQKAPSKPDGGQRHEPQLLLTRLAPHAHSSLCDMEDQRFGARWAHNAPRLMEHGRGIAAANHGNSGVLSGDELSCLFCRLHPDCLPTRRTHQPCQRPDGAAIGEPLPEQWSHENENRTGKDCEESFDRHGSPKPGSVHRTPMGRSRLGGGWGSRRD